MQKEHVHYDVPIVNAEIKEMWYRGHPQYSAFKVGYKVLMRIQRPGRLNIHKFSPLYKGPFTVIKVNQYHVTYELRDDDLGNIYKAHHVQLKVFKKPPRYILVHLDRFPLSGAPEYKLPDMLETSNEESSYVYGCGSGNDLDCISLSDRALDICEQSPFKVIGDDTKSSFELDRPELSDENVNTDDEGNLVSVEKLKTRFHRLMNPQFHSVLKPSGTYEKTRMTQVLRLFEADVCSAELPPPLVLGVSDLCCLLLLLLLARLQPH